MRIIQGLSVATMDKKFQDRRRINHNRNKPRHAVYGITQGATYFGSSIASGVAGLVVCVQSDLIYFFCFEKLTVFY